MELVLGRDVEESKVLSRWVQRCGSGSDRKFCLYYFFFFSEIRKKLNESEKGRKGVVD